MAFWFKATLIVFGVGMAVYSFWFFSRPKTELVLQGAPFDSDDEIKIVIPPDDEGFVLSCERASLSSREITLIGRFQTFVKPGSQYATWRQFPSAVQYEVETPTGAIEKTSDLTLSISDEPQTYERYAAEPSNQIVGESYRVNTFDLLSNVVTTPGTYRIRAHYFGEISNWVDVDVEP